MIKLTTISLVSLNLFEMSVDFCEVSDDEEIVNLIFKLIFF